MAAVPVMSDPGPWLRMSVTDIVDCVSLVPREMLRRPIIIMANGANTFDYTPSLFAAKLHHILSQIQSGGFDCVRDLARKACIIPSNVTGTSISFRVLTTTYLSWLCGEELFRMVISIRPRPVNHSLLTHRRKQLPDLFEMPDNLLISHLTRVPSEIIRPLFLNAHPFRKFSIPAKTRDARKSPYIKQLLSYYVQRRQEVYSSSRNQMSDDLISLDPMSAHDLPIERPWEYVLRLQFGAEFMSIATPRRLQSEAKTVPTWPQKVPMDIVYKRLRGYWDVMNISPPLPCGVCDRVMDKSRLIPVLIGSSEFNNLHWTLLKTASPKMIELFGFEFDDPVLSGCVLYPESFKSSSDGRVIDVCVDCHTSLSKKRLPKFSLANSLYRGRLPSEFADLTWVEEMVCSLYRPTAMVARLFASSDPATNRVFKGNTCAHQMDINSTVSVLPRTPEDVNGNISVVFLGSSPYRSACLKTVFFVRKKKIWSFLNWLVINNPLYAHVTLDSNILDQYPEDDMLPGIDERVVESNTGLEDTIFEAETAGLSEHPSSLVGNDPTSDNNFPIVFLEKTGVTDPDASRTKGRNVHASAVENLVRKPGANADLLIPNGYAAIPEYDNPSLFPGMYPTIFPYGIGGFDDRSRIVDIGFNTQVNALLDSQDRLARFHWSFLFVALNISQRRAQHLHTHIEVSKPSFANVAAKLSSVSSESLMKLAERIRVEGNASGLTEAERDAYQLLKKVNTIAAKIPGSQASMLRSRSAIYSYVSALGIPILYLTLNCVAQHSPVCQVMMGDTTVDLSKRCPKLVSAKERAQRVAKDPVTAADFFQFSIKAVFEELFGWDFETQSSSPDGGILGKLSGFYGIPELTNRGVLHGHFLIWLKGALNPRKLHSIMKTDLSYREQFFEFFQDIISHELPDVECHELLDKGFDPRTERPPRPPLPTDDFKAGTDYGECQRIFVAEIGDYELKKCGERLQRHKCQQVCHKYGNDNKCRFKFPHEIIENYWYDEENNAVIFAVRDATVNYFNRYLLIFCRHNHDLKCILSGKAAKGAMFYITDYITKMDKKTDEVLSLMVRAAVDCENDTDEELSVLTKSKRMLRRCLHQFTKQTQVHAQMAARLMRGHGDCFPSHETVPMLSTSLMAYVRQRHSISFAADHSIGEHTSATSPEHDEADVEKERIRIERDDDGTLMFQSPVTDYIFRSEELSDICFYNFTHAFSKVKKGDKSYADMRSSARPRYAFTAKHPSFRTHELVLVDSIDNDSTTWKKIPRMIGMKPPKRDLSEQFAWFALAHFAPFSDSVPLESPSASRSITDIFDDYPMSPLGRRIIENWEELNDCEDAREADRLKKRDHSSMENSLLSNEGLSSLLHGEGSESADDQSAFKPNSLRSVLYNQSQTDVLKDSGFFNSNSDVSFDTISSKVLPDGLRPDADAEALWCKRWKNELKTHAQQIAAKRQNVSDVLNQVTVETVAKTVLNDEVNNAPSDLVRPTVSNTQVSGPISHQQVVENIGRARSLNSEQWIAYRMICDAFLERHLGPQGSMDKSKPTLRLLLTGPGGTGKTHVVNSVKEVMRHYDCAHRLRFLAPTGGAASLIDGSTIHSGLKISIQKTNNKLSENEPVTLSVGNKEQLRRDWKSVYVVFIDEVSMVGLDLLAKVDYSLRFAKENEDDVFGGLIVILSGDLYQFPPVCASPVYSTIYVHTGITNDEVLKRLGKVAWNSITDVVDLHRQHRMKQDPEYGEAVTRLRTAQRTSDNVRLFNSRVVKGLNSPDGLDLTKASNSSVVIVKSNSLRASINNMKAISMSRAVNSRTLFRCEALDEYADSSIRLPTSLGSFNPRKHALNCDNTEHASIKNLSGILPLYIGMPVILKDKNIHTDLHLTNGATGFVWHVMFRREHDLSDVLSSVFVYFPQCPVQLSNLPLGVVPILPIKKKFFLDLHFPDGLKRVAITRKQVPLQPAFAITAQFAQGQTIPVNISSLRKGGAFAYVCASRATSRDGLFLLTPVSLQDLNAPRHPDLIHECKRLDILRYNTMVKNGLLPGPLKTPMSCFKESMITKIADMTSAKPKGELVSESPLIVSANPVPTISSGPSMPCPVKNGQKRLRLLTHLTSSTTPVSSQQGPQWSTDYSCAYDVSFMSMFCALKDNVSSFLLDNASLPIFSRNFFSVLQTTIDSDCPDSFNESRDFLRDELSALDSVLFPRRGPVCISVERIFRSVCGTGSEDPVLSVKFVRTCLKCRSNYESNESTIAPLLHESQLRNTRRDMLPIPCPLSVWIDRAHSHSRTELAFKGAHILSCGQIPDTTIRFVSAPPIILFDVQSVNGLPVLPDRLLTFVKEHNDVVKYRLVSIIYYGHVHFTASLFFRQKRWSYDGQLHRGVCESVPDDAEFPNLRPPFNADCDPSLFVYIRTE